MNKHKILLGYQDDDGNYHAEVVWAIKEGEFYRIGNIPFYAEYIALDDLVAASLMDGLLYFDRLVEVSGHSVIQMMIFDQRHMPRIVQKLKTFGCKWEQSDKEYLIAFDIPPGVSYIPIRKWLEDGAKKKYWDYQEARLSHTY